MLTVAGFSGFVDQGGMIQFRLEANKVRFDVSLAAGRVAGLGISSKLLTVARAVRKD